MNEIECCVCLETINDNSKIINCDRCINIICINCFEKIEKKIDDNFLLCYTCPSCNLEVKLNIEDYDVIKKYNLVNYLKKLIIFQNNSLNTLQITNNVLQNKLEYLLFCGSNSYKILKTFYLFDKMFIITLIGILYLIF
tara:strand:- start:5433 stop:5849 length:417 start_codon:yes stop_codon:yes gene_type:complete